MAAVLTVIPAAPDHAVDAVRVNITGASNNDASAHDEANYPADPEIRYHLQFENPAGDDGISQVLSVAQDGTAQFNNYIFPNAGAWNVNLVDLSDDSTAATVAVTVG